MFKLIVLILRIYTRLTCRIDAPDLQTVPATGPLIVITNHTGQIEVPMMYAHLQPRKLTAWAKAEAFEHWFLNYIFNLWGVIPVRRGEGFEPGSSSPDPATAGAPRQGSPAPEPRGWGSAPRTASSRE